MSLKRSDLSADQEELLTQFRRNVSDILTPEHTDSELLKWLRARDFDLQKSERLFREVDASRKTYDVKGLVNTYEKLEVTEKYELTSLLGFCKEGSLVRYIGIAMDMNGFLMSMTQYEICLYVAYVMECDFKLQKEENKKTGRDINDVTYVIDMDEFILQNFLNKYIIQLGLDYTHILQDHFPEFARRMFFVNVPSVFDKIYSIFKPMVRESLRRRIFVAPPESTGELLRKYIDVDVLPAFLGGNRYDSKGDTFCREFVRCERNVIIPKEYYLKNCRHMITSEDEGVETVYIAARYAYNVPLIIKTAGTRMKIEFRTDNGPIHFCILYRDFGNDPENPDVPTSSEYLDPYDEKSNVTLVSLRLRCLSHLWSNTEVDIAHKAGIHILQFDNSDSWFTSRTLYYRVTLLEPDT